METKRVAIGELEGAALDFAVANAARNGAIHVRNGQVFVGLFKSPFRPTKNWSQCGPLIVRYEITVTKDDGAGFCAGTNATGAAWGCIAMENPQNGDSYIQAALRAIVASHNPDGYVDVPVELLP